MYEFQENGTGWYPADEPIIERYLNLQAGETYTITTELSAVSGSMDGRFSIFTPVPAPAALALFGLVGITRKRRRT
jgi:MYXO-CTERM domain-containing protein